MENWYETKSKDMSDKWNISSHSFILPVIESMWDWFLEILLWYSRGDFFPESQEKDDVHDEDSEYGDCKTGDEEPNVKVAEVVVVKIKSADKCV